MKSSFSFLGFASPHQIVVFISEFTCGSTCMTHTISLESSLDNYNVVVATFVTSVSVSTAFVYTSAIMCNKSNLSTKHSISVSSSGKSKPSHKRLREIHSKSFPALGLPFSCRSWAFLSVVGLGGLLGKSSIVSSFLGTPLVISPGTNSSSGPLSFSVSQWPSFLSPQCLAFSHYSIFYTGISVLFVLRLLSHFCLVFLYLVSLVGRLLGYT